MGATTLLRILGISLIAGCNGGPDLAGGVDTEVILLASGFVRFEGQRVPIEEFLLRIRERVRAAGDDAERYPAVRVLIEGGTVPGLLDRLLQELQSAGVRHVTLG